MKGVRRGEPVVVVSVGFRSGPRQGNRIDGEGERNGGEKKKERKGWRKKKEKRKTRPEALIDFERDGFPLEAPRGL